jgi:hypothetical protein
MFVQDSIRSEILRLYDMEAFSEVMGMIEVTLNKQMNRAINICPQSSVIQA